MKSSYFAKLSACVVVAGSLALAGSTHAQIPYPNIGTPVTTPTAIITSGGDVTVTFLGNGTASFTDLLFESAPNTVTSIFNNQTTPIGTTVDLGFFAAGIELIFGMDVLKNGDVWYTGPGSRNADGVIHDYALGNYLGNPNAVYVAFEDLNLNNHPDYNYQDLQFSVTGATLQSVPDATATLPLMGVGLAGLLAVGRRFRK